MENALREEQASVVAETTRIADAERRSWRFTASLILSNVAFALAPLVPRAERVFGALRAQRALLIVTPGLVAVLVSVALSKRFDSDSRLRQAVEMIESLCLYASPLAFIFVAGVDASPIWALCPFTAIFWALTKPFHRWMYLTMAATTFEWLARRKRSALPTPSPPPCPRLCTVAHLKTGGDHTVCAQDDLVEGVAHRLDVLTQQLREMKSGGAFDWAAAARQAESARLELMSVVFDSRAPELPASWETLAAVIESKCRMLAVGVEYRQRITGNPATPIAANTALAALRITQELVRNAVTHGSARVVTVGLHHTREGFELSVHDDGSGLSGEQLAGGTGGLGNARSWASEQGGTLERAPGEANVSGTALIVRLPADVRRMES
ncbi:MAG: sensor histidine kinase [Myxococcaceae bacterium]